MRSLALRSKLALRLMLASLVLATMTSTVAGVASAQCATCPTATVAYQPVVAQPAVAYQPYTGWYPGKWLDQWRLRRAGVAATAPAYTASYAPTYTASYAPTYTAAYAPAYTAAHRPYVTAYAPLSAPAAASCNTCTQTAYYPVAQTVARQVVMRPVVVAPACNTCSFTPSCGCDACSTGGVSQATYNQPYSEPACSSCAGGGAVTQVVPPGNSFGTNVGPQTPRPSLGAEPAPVESRYPPRGSSSRDGDPIDDGLEEDLLKKFDPGPSSTDSDPNTFYNAPRLLDPRDRTAARSYNQSRKPTVDVWTAVYRGPTKHRNVSQSGRRARTQAEIDADGWTAVSSNR